MRLAWYGVVPILVCLVASCVVADTAADPVAASPESLIRYHIDHNEWDKVAAEIDAAAKAAKPEVSAWWYYWLGKHYRNVWLYGRAVPRFAKAIELRRGCSAGPKLSVMERALVDACARITRWDSATAETVKKLAATYPKDSAFAHECLGIAYQGQRKYKEAIAELKQIAEPEPASAARKRLAECYRDGLPPAEAAPLIQDLANSYPKDAPDLLPMVGLLYLNAKADEKAAAVFNDLSARFPDCRWQESLYLSGQGLPEESRLRARRGGPGAGRAILGGSAQSPGAGGCAEGACGVLHGREEMG